MFGTIAIVIGYVVLIMFIFFSFIRDSRPYITMKRRLYLFFFYRKGSSHSSSLSSTVSTPTYCPPRRQTAKRRPSIDASSITASAKASGKTTHAPSLAKTSSANASSKTMHAPSLAKKVCIDTGRAPVKMDTAYAAVAELDRDLRRFMVRSTEGEIVSVDTSDRSSIFYGPAWTRILGAYDSGECIRGVVKCPTYTRATGQLSGYAVNISGVEVFMPISKSAWFRSPEHDPVGKCVAVKVTAVYPGGTKAGTVTVDAWEPWKKVLEIKQRGNTMLRLAMDHDGSDLIFPLRRMETLRAPISSALAAARAAGLNCGPDLLTGHIWELSKHGRGDICEVISCLKD